MHNNVDNIVSDESIICATDGEDSCHTLHKTWMQSVMYRCGISFVPLVWSESLNTFQVIFHAI